MKSKNMNEELKKAVFFLYFLYNLTALLTNFD